MRNQYLVLMAVLTALFGYGAYNLTFGNEPGAIGHVVGKAFTSPLTTAQAEMKKEPGFIPEETLTLSRSNVVSFRSVVGPLSVAKAQKELIDKSKKLPKGDPIYLVLDTPGGSVDSGFQLVDTAKSLGRPVHTITNFAASMGFYIVERLNTRYILPSGTLMAHRMRTEGVGGQVPGEFVTAADTTIRMAAKMDNANAARLGISYESYTAMVRDEKWWTGADEAISQGAADVQASIQCDDTLNGTSKETFQTFFGEAEVTFADCPAITAPLDVRFKAELTFQQEQLYKTNVRALRALLSRGY